MKTFSAILLMIATPTLGMLAFGDAVHPDKGTRTAYVICADDGAENEVSRALTNGDRVVCVKGHDLIRIVCPKDGVINKLRNSAGGLNTQCSKDGASLIALPQDKKSNEIKEAELKSYPKAMRDRYELFAQRCSKCHKLARAINAPFNAADWQRYVKRMVRRPGSGIKKGQGEEIYRFLKFYSQQNGEVSTEP